jgi:hypothetical protein
MKVLRTYFQATRLAVVLIYAAVVAAALLLAHNRLNYPAEAAPYVAPAETTVVESTKPYFSLSTNRTFGTQHGVGHRPCAPA